MKLHNATLPVVAAIGLEIACARSEPTVVGLIFPPSYHIEAAERQDVGRVVHQLAAERFVGSPDTVNGLIYPLGPGTPSDPKRYLLVLPYGDRETSRWNDTASLYVLAVGPRASSFSPRYTIPVGRGRELHVVKTTRIASGATLILGCVVGRDEGPTQFALSFTAGVLRTETSPSSRSGDCPRLDVVP